MSPLRNRDSHRCAWERGGNGTERTCNDGDRDGAHRKNARRCAAPAAGVISASFGPKGKAGGGHHPPSHAHPPPSRHTHSVGHVSHLKHVSMLSQKKKVVPPFDQEQAALLKRSEALPHVALVSELSHGFVSVKQPPQKLELFVDGHAESLSLASIFAVAHSGSGTILSVGLGSLLNLCQLHEGTHEPPAVCGAHPTVLKTRAAAPPGHSHHRRLLLTPQPTSQFVIELLS